MELVLNLVWAAFALMGLAWWLHLRRGAARRTQLGALAMLVVFLFPVISVTDDYMAAQNPAESDARARRIDLTVNRHAVVSEVPLTSHEQIADFAPVFLGYIPANRLAPLYLKPDYCVSHFTRPPPAA